MSSGGREGSASVVHAKKVAPPAGGGQDRSSRPARVLANLGQLALDAIADKWHGLNYPISGCAPPGAGYGKSSVFALALIKFFNINSPAGMIEFT
jgi:hypothetical protein